MKQYKILALFGQSGSGKDTILKEVLKRRSDFNQIIHYTTRPPRQNEINGKDYYFVGPGIFLKKVMDGSMLEVQQFNNWFYGTSIGSLKQDKLNIGVFSISSIEMLLENEELDILPIFIFAQDKIRLLRQLNRENVPNCNEICRRFQTDRQDFSYIPFENFEMVWNNADTKANLFGAVNDIISFGQNHLKTLV